MLSNGLPLEDIFETLREPFLILDSQLTVLKANNAFCDYFGVSAGQMENKLLYEADHRWYTPALKKLLEEILPQQKVVNDFEIQFENSAFGIRTLLLNARRIDHQRFILLAFEDITNSKRFLVEQVQKVAELKNQVTELESFSAIAAHDLKSPLAEIGMSTEILQKNNIAPQEVHSYLDGIMSATKKMTRLIYDLLSYAQPVSESKKVEKINLNEVVDQMKSSMNNLLAQTGATIEKNSLPFVDGNIYQIRQLFQNLIQNSVKYSSPGSLPQIKIEGSEENGRVELKFHDNGIGFDEKDALRVFEPFQRLNNNTEGTGLGLAICKKIVEAHGGSITVTSSPGAGSTFSINLPQTKKNAG